MNERKYIQNVVKSYTEKETTKVDEIRTLDSKVKKPVIIFSYILIGD